MQLIKFSRKIFCFVIKEKAIKLNYILERFKGYTKNYIHICIGNDV